MTIVVPQLLSPRQASMRTRLPWVPLRAELEQAGYRVLRVAGRERVAADDLAAFLESARQPNAQEVAARVDLALDRAMQRLGMQRGKRRAGAPR